jgi:heptosyltransferase-2
METRKMNALIIETAFLGDTIVSLGLAREIKRLEPESRVTYLVRPVAEEVIGASPDVDCVLTFDKHGSERGLSGIRKKAKEINTLEFDTLFLLHGSRRSQALAALIQAKNKVGFEQTKHAGLTHSVKDSGWTNRYERAIFPLTALLPDADIHSLPKINPPHFIHSIFERYAHVVTIAPGSAWETKKWGDNKFFALAAKLVARNIGVVVIGGNEERELAERIHASLPEGSVLDLAGNSSFLTSAGAIAQSRLLIANDSAPTHAAVAVGTYVMTIFGPTVPSFGFAPPEGKGEVIEVDGLWCRPCTNHGSNVCPIYTHDCMEEIGVEDVLGRVLKSLDK